MRHALSIAVAALVLAGCSALQPPITQVEAIAACYTAAADEQPTLEVDRDRTRASQQPDVWTVAGVGSTDSGAAKFSCEVTNVGEVVRVTVTVDRRG
jgi:uncharacterized lipoprotein YajG